MMVEICCSSIDSIQKTIKYGGNRIELCENLINDGVTPSENLLLSAISISQIPLNILIRPRTGSFVYHSKEIDLIETQIKKVKSLPVNGIVIGVLTEKNDLPLKILTRLVRLAKPLDLTFHRAFDSVNSPIESMKKLIEIGFNRILTSGQQTTAEKGLNMLLKLKDEANGKITIMPGGGINDMNCNLFLKNGFKEIHLSAKKKYIGKVYEPIADEEIIKKVVSTSLLYRNK